MFNGDVDGQRQILPLLDHNHPHTYRDKSILMMFNGDVDGSSHFKEMLNPK